MVQHKTHSNTFHHKLFIKNLYFYLHCCETVCLSCSTLSQRLILLNINGMIFDKATKIKKEKRFWIYLFLFFQARKRRKYYKRLKHALTYNHTYIHTWIFPLFFTRCSRFQPIAKIYITLHLFLFSYMKYCIELCVRTDLQMRLVSSIFFLVGFLLPVIPVDIFVVNQGYSLY